MLEKLKQNKNVIISHSTAFLGAMIITGLLVAATNRDWAPVYAFIIGVFENKIASLIQKKLDK